MSHQKIDEYLGKVQEYSTLSLVQKCMQRPSFSNEVLDRVRNRKRIQDVKGAKPSSGGQEFGVVRHIQTQAREESKRKQYIACIRSLAKENFPRK